LLYVDWLFDIHNAAGGGQKIKIKLRATRRCQEKGAEDSDDDVGNRGIGACRWINVITLVVGC